MKYTSGNLIDLFNKGEFDVIIHGTSCFNTMEAGIARQIATRFPSAYMVDKQHYNKGLAKPGGFSFATINGDRFIFNAYTQAKPDTGAEVENISQSLESIAVFLTRSELTGIRIGIPKIGCGLGGLDWNTVHPLVSSALAGFDVTCVIYEEPEPEPEEEEEGFEEA